MQCRPLVCLSSFLPHCIVAYRRHLHTGMYNGFEWYGRTLEVREDRYAGLSGPGSYRGSVRGVRGGLRGSSGLRGGFRGGYRGGFAGGVAAGGGGRDFSSQDLYADYSGPDSQGNIRMGGYGDSSAYGGAGAYGGAAAAVAAGAAGGGAFEPEPSQQIMVRNVSASPKHSL